jgi:hypothetical protein
MPDRAPPPITPYLEPTPRSAPAAPALAGPAAAEPVPVAKTLRLARTILAGTFTPRAFLEAWAREPARWSTPLELLSVNGLLVGGAVYLGHLLGWSVESDPHLARAVAGSRVTGVLVDLFNSALPVVAVWSQVLAIRVGAVLCGAGGGWPRAIRLAGFLSAYYVPVSLLSLAAGAVAGFDSPAFLGLTGATLVIELVYSWLGFRRLYALGRARALVGALVGLVLAVVLEQAFALVTLTGAVLLGSRFPR